MLLKMLCRMCRCFAEPEPSPKSDPKEQAKAKKPKGKKA